MAKRKEEQIDRAEAEAALYETDQNGQPIVPGFELTGTDAANVAVGSDERLTILDAAAYLDVNVNSFRNAIKHRPEFTAAGVVIREKVPGSNYELVKISKSALDAYDANRKSGDGLRMRDGTRKFIVRLTQEQIEQFSRNELDTSTIELVPASQRSVKAVTNGAAEVFDTDEDHGTENQGDNDLAGASADTDDRPVLDLGMQDEANEQQEVNYQRW